MSCSSSRIAEDERILRALSVGPAAALALSAGVGSLRVHGVFASTVNLEVLGTRRLVSLCGPRGASYPHAVVLERPLNVDALRLPAGTPARFTGGSIRLALEHGTVVVDLEHAERPPARALPGIQRLGAAHRACCRRLAEYQVAASCELRIDALLQRGGPTSPLGARLRDAALALAGAARPLASSSLRRATAALLGLGTGLTPSGDDLLCGFMAAARASGLERLARQLGEAAELELGRTGTLSGFLVRCATEGFWPSPLWRVAQGIARDDEADSLVALGELCALGHSSGCDLATGFLFGLEALTAAAL